MQDKHKLEEEIGVILEIKIVDYEVCITIPKELIIGKLRTS